VSDRPDPSPAQALLDRIREDALVTRRDYLRILVTVSGGLLVGTVAVAAGIFRRRDVDPGTEMFVARGLEPGRAVAFRYPTEEDPAIAIRLSDGVIVGYSAVCTHLSCAVLWRAEHGSLECPCHDGVFDPRDGDVVAGPPPRPLPRIVLEERGDEIYAIGTTEGGTRAAS
jgi:nitrite reductase/ring-hydroxylating ferredoxin subunit